MQLPGTPVKPDEIGAGVVRRSTGEIVLHAADLPGGPNGAPWGHCRSFASRLDYDDNISQGFNWLIAQWPYIVPNCCETVVVMGEANAPLWFDWDAYTGRYGIQQQLRGDQDGPFLLVASDGSTTSFTALDDKNTPPGAFISHTDAAGNVTKVISRGYDGIRLGEVQRTSTDDAGNVFVDSYVYQYDYQPTDFSNAPLASVLWRRQVNGGEWNNIRQALYTYYDGLFYGGSKNDLALVEVQAWLDDQWFSLGTTLYRYYLAPTAGASSGCSSSSSGGSSSSSSSGPAADDSRGLGHLLQYVVEPDSYARMLADPNMTGQNPFLAPDWLVALYADYYFEYDGDRRATLVSLEGGSRTYTFDYPASEFGQGDYNAWTNKTIETLPGGTQNLTYANSTGQVMLSVRIAADAPDTPPAELALLSPDVASSGTSASGPWYTYYRYDASARIVVKAESSAITGYDETCADLLDCQTDPPLPPGEGRGEGASSLSSSSSSGASGTYGCPPIAPGNLQYLADHAGLIHLYDYDPASGFVLGERIRNGEFGYDNKLWERSYLAYTVPLDVSSSSSSSSSSSTSSSPSSSTCSSSSSSSVPPIVVYLLSAFIQYPDDITVDPNQSRQIVTTYAYTFHAGTGAVQSRTTTWPVVSTEQNGSGVADSRVEVFDTYGNITWTLDERGFIHYQGHNVTTGAVIQTITDFDTSLSGQPTPPAGWSTPTGGGLNLITEITVDSLGRTTQVLGPWHEIDISGVATSIRRATWTIYQDAAFQIWSGQGYATGNAGALPPLPPGEGWGEGASSSSSTSGTYNFVLVNPVSITMMDASGRVTDQISAIRSTLPFPPGEGWGEGVLSAGPLSSTDSFPQSSYCRWTTNQYTDCCKLAGTRVYYAIPSSGSGEEGVNFNETIFGYDFLNRQNRVVSPGGTITRTVFDARDLPIEVWVGTNDTGATWADPTGGGATGNNMVLVSEYQYDNNLASLDGNRTAEIQHVDASTSRETNFSFDWRDRPVQITAAQDWYQVTTLDNLGRALQLDQYAQANGNLIRRSQTLFDDRSRVYQTIRYAVDPSTGTVGNSLVDNTWHDAAGNAIKQFASGSSAYTKTIIDGAGRKTTQYLGFSPLPPGEGQGEGGSSSSSSSPPLPPGEGWGEGGSPANVDGDIIVEQSETLFDAASNAIQTTFRQRYHNATGTGALTYPGGAQPVARVTYVASYPDAIGREQASANYGTNSSVILSRPSTIPARADTVLVTTTIVNPRGKSYQTIDPAGRLDQTAFDDAGRRTELILNVQTGSSSSASSSSGSSSGGTTGLPTSDDKNNTTLWSYTADSQIATLTAVNSATGNQITMYLYGTSLPGSDIARNDVLASVVYPDGGIVTYLVNRQSQVKQFTDQRLVIHAYSFDFLGRQTQDAVICLGPSSNSSSSSSSSGSSNGDIAGSAVDGTVQRIGRTYEVRGLLENITSYSSPIVGQGRGCERRSTGL